MSFRKPQIRCEFQNENHEDDTDFNRVTKHRVGIFHDYDHHRLIIIRCVCPNTGLVTVDISSALQ